MNIKVMGCKDVDWIGLVEDRGKWLGVTNTAKFGGF